MAYGDQGPRKKTMFERLTIIVVVIMVIITVGGILLSAYSALR